MEARTKHEMYKLKKGEAIYVVNDKGWPQKCIFLGSLDSFEEESLHSYTSHYLILNTGNATATVISPLTEDGFCYYMSIEEAKQKAIEFNKKEMKWLQGNIKALNNK